MGLSLLVWTDWSLSREHDWAFLFEYVEFLFGTWLSILLGTGLVPILGTPWIILGNLMRVPSGAVSFRLYRPHGFALVSGIHPATP